MDELFPGLHLPQLACPYRVLLHNISRPIDHYEVRLWLLAQEWLEWEDWYINNGDQYTIWFKDIGKATYFKLSFSHDPEKFNRK
jgi:hypothetical protein